MTFRRPQPAPEPPVWLDARRAAAHCGCHPESIRRAYRAGALQGFRVGRTLRFTRAHLNEWIESGGSTHVRASDDLSPLPTHDAAMRRWPLDEAGD